MVDVLTLIGESPLTPAMYDRTACRQMQMARGAAHGDILASNLGLGYHRALDESMLDSDFLADGLPLERGLLRRKVPHFDTSGTSPDSNLHAQLLVALQAGETGLPETNFALFRQRPS